MIPYGRQDINQDDIDAVVEVLRSDYLTQGPVVPAFEKAVASYCGVQYSVAANSATSALHIACLALGVGPDDLVWTTPITFVATANCALYCGAQVDFVDIDPQTYNMSVERLSEKLAHSEIVGKLPKVVIPVHLCGQSCDMDAIQKLSQQYGFKIIEDASHAIGGRYKDAPIGSCQYSDITVFSFHPVKIVTTGEGGMVLTNDVVIAEKMELLRSHGITRDSKLMTRESDGPWYYQQIDLGFNYRMTDLQAALGLSQMQRITEFVSRRHTIAKRYNHQLADLPLVLPWHHPDSYSGLHIYVIRLKLGSISKTHREIFEAMRNAGIGVNLHYIPVHLQPFYQKMGFEKGDFSEAERYYAEAITLPLYPGLSEEEQDKVIAALKQVLSE
jgi:UDP-4-amino-4,6-dideoxy-N-acetyl-beta-L-altrosamine transaminase